MTFQRGGGGGGGGGVRTPSPSESTHEDGQCSSKWDVNKIVTSLVIFMISFIVCISSTANRDLILLAVLSASPF